MPRLTKPQFCAALALAAGALAGLPLRAAPALQILLPLGRTSYQDNELIDVQVVRSDTAAIPAGDLKLVLTGEDGSVITSVFPVSAVDLANNAARVSEFLRLNGWLLKPGKYTLTVTEGEASATSNIEVFSHVRGTTFKLINWGSPATDIGHTIEGPDSIGFNVIQGDFRVGRTARQAEFTLRGGADYLENCTMSGAHQMDLRAEDDWSDPYVTRGGTARVVQQAFLSRTTPNALGVHFYDEPGLTWWTDPATKENTPHNIPSQDRSYKSAFGTTAPQYNEVKPGDAAAVARWNHMARWKESFMEAAWKEASYGVSLVRPDYISITQSQYAWNAYADGYYFNVVRSLPVISGHGGYDDGMASYFYPGYFLEFGRMRDFNKPNWYLPTWYVENADTFRVQQNLSFINNIQGMSSPPWLQAQSPAGKSMETGVVAANKTMARLGTIFDTMPQTRGDVAVLYSFDQVIDAEIKSGMKDNYEGGTHGRDRLLQVYLAGKMLHVPFWPIVEEDILDGTLAAHHKAVILSGINKLDPQVISALEDYMKAGGTVLMSDDCQAVVPGATKLGVEASTKAYDKASAAWTAQSADKLVLRGAGYFTQDAEPLAKALKSQFDKLGIKPVLDVDNESIVVSRQAQGDIEYLFAVNANYDFAANNPTAIKAASANIKFPADGRPVYDALFGRVASEFTSKSNGLVARESFGPGEMKAWARTSRPIGGVVVSTPELTREYTATENPIHLTATASLVDKANKILSGAAPLRVRVTDPLGAVRYDLYRATKNGICDLNLPMAANDPAGTWTIAVQELLSGTTGKATLDYRPAGAVGAIAGTVHRAVFFGNDRENIFRFARNHHDVTIVKGTSPYDDAAATRLATVLGPWGVRCTVVNAADVNKPRKLTPEEAATWVGIDFGKVEAEDQRRPTKVGFAINGPAILLGNSADNPLIKTVETMGFLPYQSSADLPGHGRGYIAWQRDAIGIGQESLTLIADDAAGMSEAVGTTYEAVAGLDPMTPMGLPTSTALTPATKANLIPEAATAWEVVVPDRPDSLAVDAAGIHVVSDDGTTSTIDATGKVTAQTTGAKIDQEAKTAAPTVPPALSASLLPGKVAKFVAATDGATAIAYWGGTVQVVDSTGKVKSSQYLSQDISGLAWQGSRLIVALADGRVVGLNAK